MDSHSFHYPSMAASSSSPKSKLKRPCCSSSSSSSFVDHLNDDDIMISDSSSMRTGRSDHHHIDSLLESFLRLPESSDSLISQSFDRIIESVSCDSEKSDMIDRSLKLGSVLLEAAKRSARQRDSVHNAVVWPLPPELTIQVFSFLNTQSLSYAAAACSNFNKCAVDPVCYTHVDLASVNPIVNNTVVSTMVQRAGKSLQSLKLGLILGQSSLSGSPQALVFSVGNSLEAPGSTWIDRRSRQGRELAILTRSCLACLSANGGTSGALLRRLHLHNIERIDNMALGAALSSCPSLLDFEIAGLPVELKETLESISKCCPLMERLSFESSKTGRDDSLKLQTCNELVNGCPNLSYLSLRGFKLLDFKARVLVKGFRKLKFVDFSTSYSITGSFLKYLGGNLGGDCIEVLMLRDCTHLKQVEVSRLFSSLLVGDFKHLRLLDISNREGLASDDDWCNRLHDKSFIPEQLAEKRPHLCLLAEFPGEGSYMEVNNDYNSDGSGTQSPASSSSTSDTSMIASSESSDGLELSSSSSSSGDSEDVVYAVYGESSDELDTASG